MFSLLLIFLHVGPVQFNEFMGYFCCLPLLAYVSPVFSINQWSSANNVNIIRYLKNENKPQTNELHLLSSPISLSEALSLSLSVPLCKERKPIKPKVPITSTVISSSLLLFSHEFANPLTGFSTFSIINTGNHYYMNAWENFQFWIFSFNTMFYFLFF